MSLILYYHPMSQPSRAVLAFLLLNNIPHQIKTVEPGKRGTKQPDFQKINPLGKIPAIDDNGFLLGESEAIVRYLMNTRKYAEHFYPKEPKERAIIDMFFPFYHSIFRPAMTKTFMSTYPFLKANAAYVTVPAAREEAIAETEAGCKKFEEVFLRGKNYILGENICIADLFAFNELSQVYYTTDFDFNKVPGTKAYIERCLKIRELYDMQEAARGFREDMRKALEKAAQKALEKEAHKKAEAKL